MASRAAPLFAILALAACGLASCGFRSSGFGTQPVDASPPTDVGSDAGNDLRPGPVVDGNGRPDVPSGPDVVVPPPDTNPQGPDVPVAVDVAPAGCAPGAKLCDQICVPSAGCCGDGECTGGFACIAAACSATACRPGFKRCGAGCIAMATCCPADGCCSNADCGACQKCAAGACVNQSASEDLKNECPTAACRPGTCNGSGACTRTPDGDNGPSCMAECVRCQAGACAPRTGTCSTGQMCDGEGRCPPRPPVAVRFNVNGPQHGDFAADPGVGGICAGSPFVTDRPISGTDDDPLYQGEMFGAPLSCAAGGGLLPPGRYQVVLHFAEIYFGPLCLGGLGPGSRVFDIHLETKLVASKVDIFSEAGCAASLDGNGRPVLKRFTISITDGTLDLAFPASANNAKLSALEILSDW